MDDAGRGDGLVTMRAPVLQPISAGLLAALIGFASTFALVLQGFVAVGATAAQAASGLLAVCIVKGIVAIWLSRRSRMPISIVMGASISLAGMSGTKKNACPGSCERSGNPCRQRFPPYPASTQVNSLRRSGRGPRLSRRRALSALGLC